MARTPDPAPSTTGYALLGLLRLRSWTTYELAKQVQRSLHWFWPRAERKLYDEPKRLVAAGLAVATPGATGQRPRTDYAITAAGEEALRSWLSRPAAPRQVESEAALQVFFADAGTLEQLNAVIDRTEREAAERARELAVLAATSPEDAPFPGRLHISALSLALQVEEELAVVRWARWAREQVGRWRATDDPGPWDVDAALVAVQEAVADAALA